VNGTVIVALVLAAAGAAAEARAQGAPQGVWARYEECAPRLKPARRGQFMALPPAERAGFLSQYCDVAAVPTTVAIAPVRDPGEALPGAEDREALASALGDTLAERAGAAFEIVRLPAADAPCDRACEVERAAGPGAELLVTAEVLVSASALAARVEVVDLETGETVRTASSEAAATPAELIDAVRVAAGTCVAALREHRARRTGQLPRPEVVVALPQPTTPLTPPAAAGESTGTSDFGGSMGVTGSGPAKYKAGRGIGIAMFVIGVLTTTAGGIVWGMGNAPVGIGVAIGGDVLWIPGIVLWAVNNSRVHKIQQGRPLLGSVRLVDLAPLVAARDRGAPGLTASFAF
jgi:hypothetical protein